MIRSARDAEVATAYLVADKMLTAAKTAPKAKGTDDVIGCIVDGEEMAAIANEMRRLGEEFGSDSSIRDAGNVDNTICIVLLAAKGMTLGINEACQFCGFKNCAENQKADSTCVIAAHDLGVAVGSAVSIAADNRIDNRVMFTIGKAALSLGYFKDEGAKICMGIPLYVGHKSIYMDRNKKK